MSKAKGIIALLLLTTLGTTLYAQEVEEPYSRGKWYERLGHWVQGDPWSWQGELPMTHTKYLVQWEYKGVQDPYLSPIAHNGSSGKISFLTDYATPRGQLWHLYQDISIVGGTLKNKANGSNMYSLGLNYALGPSWRVVRLKGLTLDMAPLLALNIGGNIKLSNTNNIGNAKGSMGVEGWGRVKYQVPWVTMPLSISYSARVPLAGVAFHPGYGQTYYDYISGENGAKPGIHFSSPHNTIGIKQRLLVDLPIHNLTITLGAEHTHFTQQINYTTYKEGSWGIIIGVSVDSYKLSGGNIANKEQIYSRYY